MKILLLFLILFNLLALVQTQTPLNDETSPMSVASCKWSRARQKVEGGHTDASIPACQVIPQNKTFGRNARRQFLCGVSIRPDKEKDLEGLSLSGPSDVVNVSALADKSRFKENVVINRIEYPDGSIWRRKGWHLAEVKRSYERVLREPWVPDPVQGSVITTS